MPARLEAGTRAGAGSQVFYLACFGMCINRGLSAFIPPVSLSPAKWRQPWWRRTVGWGDGITQQSGMREGDASTIFFATRTEPEQCHRDFGETNLNFNGTWR